MGRFSREELAGWLRGKRLEGQSEDIRVCSWGKLTSLYLYRELQQGRVQDQRTHYAHLTADQCRVLAQMLMDAADAGEQIEKEMGSNIASM